MSSWVLWFHNMPLIRPFYYEVVNHTTTSDYVMQYTRLQTKNSSCLDDKLKAWSVFIHYRATRMHSADYACHGKMSVGQSVIHQYYMETAKHIIKVFSDHSSFSIPNAMAILQREPPHLNRGAECKGYEKSLFSTNISLYLGNDAR